MNGPGRVLALDFGLKRIGAAVSDPLRLIASPLEVHHRGGPEQDARHYRRLVAEEDVCRIVVGLPTHTNGAEGELARAARAFGEWLGAVTGLPVSYFDERFTSRQADELLRAQGATARARQARRDMIAAQLILREYLEAGCPEARDGAGPLDDGAPAPEP